MATGAERTAALAIARLLDEIPIDAAIDTAIDTETGRFRDALSGLAFFIPECLHQVYREWKWEGLDGLLVASASKGGPGEMEMLGLAILISDQTLTPFRVRLQVGVSRREISWMQCQLGAAGDGAMGMERIPYGGRARAERWVIQLAAGREAPQIDRVYLCG